MQAFSLTIGRILLCLIFVMSGVHKLMNWESTVERMTSQGLPSANFLLVGAVILELGGGISLLMGWMTRLGALALIVFLIPVTGVFHDFWTLTGAEQQQQMIHFMKNTAILGGLFAVMASGPGCCSMDSRSRRKRSGVNPSVTDEET